MYWSSKDQGFVQRLVALVIYAFILKHTCMFISHDTMHHFTLHQKKENHPLKKTKNKKKPKRNQKADAIHFFNLQCKWSIFCLMFDDSKYLHNYSSICYSTKNVPLFSGIHFIKMIGNLGKLESRRYIRS